MSPDTGYLFSTTTPPRGSASTVNFRMGLNLLTHLIGQNGGTKLEPPHSDYLQALFPLALMAAEKAEGLPVTNDSLLRQCAADPLTIRISPSPELPADRLADSLEYIATHRTIHAEAIAILRPMLPHQGFLVTQGGVPLALYASLRRSAYDFFSAPLPGTPADSTASLLADAFVVLAATTSAPRASSIATLLNSEYSRVSHHVSICPDGQARETITSFLNTNDPRRLEVLALIVTDALFTRFP